MYQALWDLHTEQITAKCGTELNNWMQLLEELK